MTLKRASVSDLTVYGKRVGAPSDSETVGNLRQDEIEIRIGRAEIAAASWPEPPRNGDSIVCGGRTYAIQAAQQHDDRGVVYGWKLQVVGVA